MVETKGVIILKKLMALVIVLVVVAGIVLVLFNNKAKMAAKMHRAPHPAAAVSVLTVTKQRLSDHFSQVGTLAANNDVLVVSGIQGRVTKVLVKVNDYVYPGQNLVEIFDDLGKVTSPIAGIVTDLPVTVGTMLNPNVPVANVIDISTLKLKVNLGESDVFKLKIGNSVTVTTEIYPNVKFNGNIYSISQKGDNAHTYPVEIRLSNSKQYPLKAGMFAQATFYTRAAQYGIAIPRSALLEDDSTNPQVYVVQNGIANLRNIVVGSEVGTNMIVLQGLTEGESVVTLGQSNLINGAKVRVMN
jgi:multidrug efflux pump subunit AcrA (membrane-fusion protein)